MKNRKLIFCNTGFIAPLLLRVTTPKLNSTHGQFNIFSSSNWLAGFFILSGKLKEKEKA